MSTAALGLYVLDRVVLQKALDPNNPRHFVRILRDLARATKRLSGAAEAGALRKALATLDVDWAKLDVQQRQRIVEAARQAIARPAADVAAKIEDLFLRQGKAIGSATRASTRVKHKLEIGVDLSRQDHKVLEYLAASQGNYVRDEYGRRSVRFSELAREIVADGLESGQGSAEISSTLREKLADASRSDAYWDLIASTFANRARTYANLSSYKEAMIEWFVFEAVLDERTSAVCRFMHGRRFRVERALRAYARSEKIGPEVAQPWLQQGENVDGDRVLYYEDARGNRREVAIIEDSGEGNVDDTGAFAAVLSDDALEKAGIMTPPLHGNCRSTILPDV